ncbi:DNA internalization-related competence protein ComEC/Rec2 [Aromatoleum diolicum]|nr:DNA internalization-related competence protein ComEC/Rec2 [Aromatoleum diolicum]
MAIIAFGLGVWLCQYLPQLPARGWLSMLTAASLVAGAGVYRRGRYVAGGVMVRASILLLALLIGFAWAAWRAEWRLADELPQAWEGRDVEVTGVVDELPEPSERGVRFSFRVERTAAPLPSRILLAWYRSDREGAGEDKAPAVRPGERWRFTVRLKRPHGLVNPEGFDYEAALLERGIRATGNVRAGEKPLLLDPFVPEPMIVVHRLRDAIRARFAATLPDADYVGVLIALAVGDQRAIPNEQWIIFRKTGVAHLISISGLHVSMVGLMVGWLVGKGWRRSRRRVLRWPAAKAAAAAGLVAAASYAVLAGLGIPTQRSLIMLAVIALALLGGREVVGSRVLALALLCVLLFDPWAVLSAGFWLSFGAVGILMYLLGGRLATASGWRAAIGSQLGITLATIPALLVLFNAFSLVSPFANAVAIPLVSFVITPLTLLAIVLPFAPLLQLAHWLTGLLMVVLEWMAAFPFAMWQQAAPPAMLAAAGMLGMGWMLLPRGTPARHAGLFALLPMLVWTPPRPVPGAYRMTALDVGQGTAVHVQTARHELLYDAGPAYGQGSDAGVRVLLPYLQAAGVERIDRLVISHNDLDHSGGARSLVEGVTIGDLMANLPTDDPLRDVPGTRVVACEAGTRWRWDEVDFEILHPASDEPAPNKDNDASCVLRIVAPGGSVLLVGDIERAAERSLLKRHGSEIASDVVLVPHHGSRSSSGEDFVAAIAPQAAIFSAGYLNQFRHPHPAVWDRWAAVGASNWRTDRQGAINVEVTAKGVDIQAQRDREARYWHGH